MLTKSIPYTFVRGSYFYFSRRVPADLWGANLEDADLGGANL